MNQETLTTGQLARASGVGVQTVRYYERIGLLRSPPRTAGGYRQYDASDVTRLRFVRSAQGLGFTLSEIEDLLALRVGPGKSCAAAADTADRAMARVEEKVRDLEAMRRSLSQLRSACDKGSPTGDCPILKALEDEE
jgi:Hg(II)-responsive transcriptional regulator